MTTTVTSPVRENSSGGLLQKLAVERLKYNVNELQSLVDYDRRNRPLAPPKPTTLQLVADTTAFTTFVADIKNYVADGTAKITVPSAVLDALDALKRGSDAENVNARETVRWFDRLVRNDATEKGVRMQTSSEVYGTWDECLEWYNPPPTAAEAPLENGLASPAAMTESMMLEAQEMMEKTSMSPPKTPSSKFSSASARKSPPSQMKRAATEPMDRPPSPTSPLPRPDVPRRIQPIINCALNCIHDADMNEIGKTAEGVTYLVTNNPETSYWAKRFGIPVLNTKELANRIREELRAYKERKKDFEIMHQTNEPSSRKGRDKPKQAHTFHDGRRESKLDEISPNRGGAEKQGNSGGSGGGGGSNRRRNRNNQNYSGGGSGGGGGGNRSGRGANISNANRGGHHAAFGRHHTVGASPNEIAFEKEVKFPPANLSGFRTREKAPGEPEYVLGRGANRGVARGKGKLWEP